MPDGRRLGYLAIGHGIPAFYFHGTASSRLEIRLLKELTRNTNLQIIGVDRPGYGLSTFSSERNLRAFAFDINYLAAHLGLKRFALLAWSGGGPHALTYFSLFPQHVTTAVIVSSPALPFDVATAHNNPFARYVMKIPTIGIFAFKRMQRQILKAREDVVKFMGSKEVNKLFGDWCEEDAKFFADLSWLTLMLESMAEAFRQNKYGARAVLQEHQIFAKPWSEPLSKIPSGKVNIWQGTDDKTCRVDNAYRLAQAVPGAHLKIYKGQGHCLIFDNLVKLGETLI